MGKAKFDRNKPHVNVGTIGHVEAGDGTRTRDPQLGRLMLYQLSYSRVRRQRAGRGNGGEKWI